MKFYGLLIASALIAIPAAARAQLSTVLAFDPTLGELPESIAADASGNLYVSMANIVKKVTASGQVSTLASLPVPQGIFTTGVKFGPNGSLFVGAAPLAPNLDASGVWEISPSTGDAELFASLDGTGFPNDLAFDGAGNAFVTDSALGLIYKIAPDGVESVWISDPALLGNASAPVFGMPFGANGIAFDKYKRNLYVSNSDYGQILRIPVRSNGTAGPIHVVASDPLLTGADGIAFDKKDTLYVAVNIQDRLATVNRCGQISVLAEGGLLDGPSAFAFGVRGSDKKKLFITSFAILRATTGGDPHPAILSLNVPHAGLSIP
jgi:sugar lactone lactonase YvrE